MLNLIRPQHDPCRSIPYEDTAIPSINMIEVHWGIPPIHSLCMDKHLCVSLLPVRIKAMTGRTNITRLNDMSSVTRFFFLPTDGVGRRDRR